MSELNFLDLVILYRIDENSTMENLRTVINASFFEAANILGTMKVKGLIDIKSSVGGASSVTLAPGGVGALDTADAKALEQPDQLDDAILHTLSTGVRDLEMLAVAVNVRSSDLAYHLHKLHSHQLIDYSVRTGKVSVSLTEQGFNRVGAVRAVQGPAPPAVNIPASPAPAVPLSSPVLPKEVPEQEPAPEKEGPIPEIPSAPPAYAPRNQPHAWQMHPANPESQRQTAPTEEMMKTSAALKKAEQAMPIPTKRFFSKIEYYLEKYLLAIALIAVLLLVAGGYLLLKRFGII